MAQDNGQGGMNLPLDLVQVGVTYAARMDANANFMRTGFRCGQFFQLKRILINRFIFGEYLR